MNIDKFPRKILITGANRGMGLGYVKHYLETGSFVVATSGSCCFHKRWSLYCIKVQTTYLP